MVTGTGSVGDGGAGGGGGDAGPARPGPQPQVPRTGLGSVSPGSQKAAFRVMPLSADEKAAGPQ